MNSVLYTISRDSTIIESQKELKGEFAWEPRVTIRLDSTLIRWFSWWWPGRKAGPCEQWPNKLKTKLNLKGDYQVQVHSGQMVLMVVRQGGWTTWTVEKDIKIRVGKQLLASKQPSKTGRVTAQKRVYLLFRRGCWRGEMMTMMLMMRWKLLRCHRTVQQQHWEHWVLKNLLSELSIYSSPLMAANEVCWEGAANRWTTWYL